MICYTIATLPGTKQIFQVLNLKPDYNIYF